MNVRDKLVPRFSRIHTPYKHVSTHYMYLYSVPTFTFTAKIAPLLPAPQEPFFILFVRGLSTASICFNSTHGKLCYFPSRVKRSLHLIPPSSIQLGCLDITFSLKRPQVCVEGSSLADLGFLPAPHFLANLMFLTHHREQQRQQKRHGGKSFADNPSEL